MLLSLGSKLQHQRRLGSGDIVRVLAVSSPKFLSAPRGQYRRPCMPSRVQTEFARPHKELRSTGMQPRPTLVQEHGVGLLRVLDYSGSFRAGGSKRLALT